MMTIPEKSKRDEKSKYIYRRRERLLYLFAAVPLSFLVIFTAGFFVFFVFFSGRGTSCACSPVDKTIAAIETSNALVATQLSETALAAVATDDMAEIAASAEAVQQTQTTEADHLMASMTAVALTLDVTADTPFPRDLTVTAIARTTAAPTQCGMFWTTEVSVENTAKLQSALHDTGLDVVSGQVLIDSERDSCRVDASGTPFALSGIFQLQFTVAAGTAETSEARGALIERLLKVTLPVDYRAIQNVRVFFEPLDVRGNQWMMQYATALQSDKHGAALFEAGDY